MPEGEHARARRSWIAFVVVVAFAFVLSVLAYTGRLLPKVFEADKEIHFVIAGLLAFFLDRATGARSLKWNAGLLAVFAADELLQRFSVNRSSSIADYAADVAGVVAFTALARVWSKARRAKPTDDVAK